MRPGAQLRTPTSALVTCSATGYGRTPNFDGWGLEDSELGYRLYQAGPKFAYHRDAILYHQHQEFSPGEIYLDWKRYLSYFRAKYAGVEVKLQWAMERFFNLAVRDLDWQDCCIRVECAARAGRPRA
jgi:hypothetical protein